MFLPALLCYGSLVKNEVDRWMRDKWVKEWIKRWVYGWVWMNGWREGCMDRYPDGWVALWMGQQMDECEGG